MTLAEFYLLLDGITESAPHTIKGDEAIADLEGWDSLAVVGFMAAVDKQLGVVVHVKGLIDARTVQDLVGLVQDKLTA